MPKIPNVLKVAKDKPEFPEDITRLKHVDPLAGPVVSEFDWEDLARMLGEPEDNSDELAEAARNIEREKLVRVVTELFRYVLQERPLKRIGRRFLALAWVVNPGLFEGDSAKGLAERYHLHPTRMYEDTGDASRQFGIRNRAQSHASNFDQPGHRKAKPMRPKQGGGVKQ